jgi:hypothetical protein
MNLSMNSIIGIVCSQINANMQSHMRGYSNSDTKSYPKEKDVNQDEQAFFNFSSVVLRFLIFLIFHLSFLDPLQNL